MHDCICTNENVKFNRLQHWKHTFQEDFPQVTLYLSKKETQYCISWHKQKNSLQKLRYMDLSLLIGGVTTVAAALVRLESEILPKNKHLKQAFLQNHLPIKVCF